MTDAQIVAWLLTVVWGSGLALGLILYTLDALAAALARPKPDK